MEETISIPWCVDYCKAVVPRQCVQLLVQGCMRAASTWRPWVSGLVGHFVQTWTDSELLSHSAVLRL